MTHQHKSQVMLWQKQLLKRKCLKLVKGFSLPAKWKYFGPWTILKANPLSWWANSQGEPTLLQGLLLAWGSSSPPPNMGKCLLLQKSPAVTQPSRSPSPWRDQTDVQQDTSCSLLYAARVWPLQDWTVSQRDCPHSLGKALYYAGKFLTQ